RRPQGLWPRSQALCWINTEVWGQQTGQSAPYRSISSPIVPFQTTICFRMTQANTYCYATLAYVSSGKEPTAAGKQCHLFRCKTELSGDFNISHSRRTMSEVDPTEIASFHPTDCWVRLRHPYHPDRGAPFFHSTSYQWGKLWSIGSVNPFSFFLRDI
ncbi:unnamed protein product, partial [Ixodes pacificus]